MRGQVRMAELCTVRIGRHIGQRFIPENYSFLLLQNYSNISLIDFELETSCSTQTSVSNIRTNSNRIRIAWFPSLDAVYMYICWSPWAQFRHAVHACQFAVQYTWCSVFVVLLVDPVHKQRGAKSGQNGDFVAQKTHLERWQMTLEMYISKTAFQ